MFELDDAIKALDAINVFTVELVEGVAFEGDNKSIKIVTTDREKAMEVAEELLASIKETSYDYIQVDVCGTVIDTVCEPVLIARFEDKTRSFEEQLNIDDIFSKVDNSKENVNDWQWMAIAAEACIDRKRVMGQFESLPLPKPSIH